MLSACSDSLRAATSRQGPTGLYTILQNPPMCSYSFTIAIKRGSPRADDSTMNGRDACLRSMASLTGVGSSLTMMMSPASLSLVRVNPQSDTMYCVSTFRSSCTPRTVSSNARRDIDGRRPWSRTLASSAAKLVGSLGLSTGSALKVTLISVPTPSADQTSTLPSTLGDRTMLLTIARPSPVPVCSGFSCENGWKSWFCSITNVKKNG